MIQMWLPFNTPFACCTKDTLGQDGFEEINESPSKNRFCNVAQLSADTWPDAADQTEGQLKEDTEDSILLSESTDTSIPGEQPISAFPVRISSNPTVIEYPTQDLSPKVHSELEDPTSMRELLARFVHRGIQGVDCDLLLDAQRGGWSRGSYCIDRGLQTITFFSSDICTTIEFRSVNGVEIEQLPVTDSNADHGVDAAPTELEELSPEQRRRLVSIAYTDEAVAHWLCFLEDSEEDSLNFKSCAQIMCHYMTNQIIAVQRSEGRDERRTRKVSFNLCDEDELGASEEVKNV